MNTTATEATAVLEPTVVTNNDQANEVLRKMDEEFVELTGRSAYLYPFAPTDTDAWRFAFTDVTVPGRTQALAHMTELLKAARVMDFSTLWWCAA